MLSEVERDLRKIQAAQSDLLGMLDYFLARTIPGLPLEESADLFIALGLQLLDENHPTRTQFMKYLEQRWQDKLKLPITYEENIRGHWAGTFQDRPGEDIMLGDEVLGFYWFSKEIGDSDTEVVPRKGTCNQVHLMEVNTETTYNRSLCSLGLNEDCFTPPDSKGTMTEKAFRQLARYRVESAVKDAYLIRHRNHFENMVRGRCGSSKKNLTFGVGVC